MYCHSDFPRKLREVRSPILSAPDVNNIKSNAKIDEVMKVVEEIDESEIVLLPFFFDGTE